MSDQAKILSNLEAWGGPMMPQTLWEICHSDGYTFSYSIFQVDIEELHSNEQILIREDGAISPVTP